MKKAILWLRIIRPQTLFASLVPVLVALHVVGWHDVPVACATVVCALSLQILSNLINDYYDFIRGTDKAGRAGFKRALAEGEVSESSMKRACLLTAVISCLIGLYLVIVGGWVILAIGLSALLFAWLYTATRYSLSYLGIADIFVFLYYGVIASCGTAYLQDGEFSQQCFYAGGVSGLISMCVLMINNLRDRESDEAVGKRTVVVRFGKMAAEFIMLAYVVLMAVFAWLAFGMEFPVFISVPAFALWVNVTRAQGSAYNKCLLMTGLLNLFYLILLFL